MARWNNDDSLINQYIRQIENPDSVGWNPNLRIWEAPKGKGFDSRNRGMGIDVLNNTSAKKLTKGRPGRYLTEAEERKLRNDHVRYLTGVIEKKKKEIPALNDMSPRKEAELIGALYRGDAKVLWSKDTKLGKALRSDNEEDFHNALSEYYSSIGLKERAKNNDVFWKNHPFASFPKPEINTVEQPDVLRVTNPYRQVLENTYPRERYVPASTENLVETRQAAPKEWQLEDALSAWTDYAKTKKFLDSMGFDKSSAPEQYVPASGINYVVTPSYAEGGKVEKATTKPNTWDDLSMTEKSEMIGIAVRNGITTLPEIKEKYNEFAGGGHLYDGTSEDSQKMETYEAPWVTEAKEKEALRRTWLDEQAEKYAQAVEDAKHPTGHYMNEVIVTSNGTRLGSVSSDAMLDNLQSSIRERQAKDKRDASNMVRHIHEGTEAAAKLLAPLVAAPAAPYLYSGITGLLANPVVDAALTADGVINAPSRIKEGIGDISNGDYGSAAWNLGTTALDLVGGANLARKATSLVKSRRVPKTALKNAASDIMYQLSDKPLSDIGNSLDETKAAAESGRQTLLDFVTSEANRERWKEAFPNRNINVFIRDLERRAQEVPFDYSRTVEELGANGVTIPRPAKVDKLNGLTVHDYNTGLDVYIGRDLGKEAYSAGIHEPIHYMTSNSNGDAGFMSEGLMGKSYNVYNTPSGPEAMVLRGNGYEHKMVDYNDALLPPINEHSGAYLVINKPEEMKKILMNNGATLEEAEKAIKTTTKHFKYVLNKQENQTHLKQWFLEEIKPNIKNPNDVNEIEKYITEHPEIIEDNSYVKELITKVRPGTNKHYANALSKMLYSLLGTVLVTKYSTK